MKTLSIKPYLHKDVELMNTWLGKYTEVGPHNYMDNVSLGDYSYTGPHCMFQNAEIGKFSNIAAQVRIGPTDHPMDRPTLHHFTYRRKLYGLDDEDDQEFFLKRKEKMSYIGHDTWLGHGVIVMPGVRIGTGAVVGSGAVVTKDIPDYGVAVGVPAKTIKYRFSEKQQEDLKKISWWNWDYPLLAQRMEDFCGSVDEFIEKYKEGS